MTQDSRQINGSDTPEQVTTKTSVARSWLDAPELSTRKPDYILRVSSHIPQASPAVQDVFIPAFRRLNEMSGGAIGVHAVWGGALHSEREGIEALLNNCTDLCPVYSAWDARMFPAAQALSLPFMFSSAEAATHVSELLYRQYFSQDFEAQGILMGRIVATGEYNLFSRSPIACLEDLQGLRVACSEGLEARIFQALGAEAIGCSTPEAKKRFATADVQAVSISDSAAFTVGLYHDAAFRTQANLVSVNLEYGLSPHFFGGLPESLRPLLNRWLRGLAQAGAQLFYGLAGAHARMAFSQAGIQSLSLDAQESSRWANQVAPVETELRNELASAGYPVDAMLRDVRQAAAETASLTSDELMTMALTQPFLNLLPPPLDSLSAQQFN
ncbi:TRAP transporter substrate-binding protein DctP [Limnohabitans sp.]|uniref:TRAP transporter substrate-binding protein DctP n=1 Tax=Limnohabitans sp. TaxID=1907725 RepID=UPI00333F5B56